MGRLSGTKCSCEHTTRNRVNLYTWRIIGSPGLKCSRYNLMSPNTYPRSIMLRHRCGRKLIDLCKIKRYKYVNKHIVWILFIFSFLNIHYEIQIHIWTSFKRKENSNEGCFYFQIPSSLYVFSKNTLISDLDENHVNEKL